MSIAAALLAATALASAQPELPSERIELAGAELRLADIARIEGFGALASLPSRNRVVARLPEGRSSVETSRAALAALVRRAVPTFGLQPGAGEGRVTILRPSPARDALRTGPCFAASGPVEPGAALSAANLRETPCVEGERAAPVRIDRSDSSLRAGASLAAGDYVGRIALPSEGAIETGQALTLVSTAGAASISRPVVALQPGRAGGRLFVRDGDGAVFAVRIAADSPDATR